MFTLIGVLSALLFLVGDSFYIRDTLFGEGRPHRIAFGIFTLINGVDLANQFAIGATNSLWLLGAATMTTAVIFGLSFKHGVGGTEPLDWIVLGGCLLGVVLWVLWREPMVSVWANVAVASLAMIPVVKKSYYAPHEEPMLPWLLCGLASVLAAISVGSWAWSLLILPIHGIVSQLGEYVFLRVRRAQLHTAPAERPDGDIPALV